MDDRIPLYKLKLVRERWAICPCICFDEPQFAAAFFHRLIGQADREHSAALFLDVHLKPTGCTILGIGSLVSTPMPAREVFKAALLANAPRVASEPELDALAVLRDLVPLDARRHQGPRLHALRDTVHLFVCERPAANQSETLGRIRVSCNGLAVDSRLATDPSIFLPRRPAAQHFLHVDHR